MKKIISLILAITLILSIAAISVSAAPGQENYGNVKKISDSDINMSNADKDAAWDYALAIPVNVGDPNNASGTTWVLWSDTAYYFYTEVNDTTPVNLDNPDNGDYFEAWVTDSVEVFIALEGDRGNLTPTPAGNFDDACWQFRIDLDGLPSSYQRDGAWTDDFLIGTDFNKDRFEWAVKQDGNKYYTKHKITWLGNPKPGELGLQIQINDLEYEGGPAPQTRANDASGSWDADQFGYVVLVDEPAVPPAAAAPAPAVEESIAQEEGIGGGNENVHPAPAVVAPVPAPATGNAKVVFAVLALVLSASVLIVKSKKSKI